MSSHFKVHSNYLGILLKYRFWFKNQEWNPIFYISSKFSGDPNVAGP